MKINPNVASANTSISSGTQAASDTKKLEKTKVAGYESKPENAASVSKSDANTEISSKAKDMAKAKQIASDAPDVREAKIAALKEQIQNKKYNVGADAIADKLVDDHIRMAGA